MFNNTAKDDHQTISFLDTNASWSNHKADQREITILESLDNPRISRSITSFETEDGLCLV